MFIHIYKNELKSFFKSSNFLSTLLIITILVGLEVFINARGSDVMLSLSMGSYLIFYVFLSESICNTYAKFKDFSHEEEFYLSKPFLRNDLYKAKLFKTITLCIMIIAIILSASFISSKSLNSKIRVNGYDNIVAADQFSKLKPVFSTKQSQANHEENMKEVADLIQAGKFKEAEIKKQNPYLSKDYQIDHLYLYDLALKFMVLIWCSISGMIYIKMNDVKTPADTMKEIFKHPLGYLKISGWICIFVFVFKDLFRSADEGIMEAKSSNLLSYLMNFNLIVVSFIILAIVLTFIVKKSYQRISL